MSILTDLGVRVRALLFRRSEERELDEELHDHLVREAAERIRRGATPDEARREAALAFGGMEQFTEQVRDARGTRPLEDLVADLRYAARGLRRSPAFTVTAVLVLSLGLGATAVVYSIAHAVVLADLPYPDPDRLVRVMEQNSPTNRWALSTADVTAIREQQRVFEAWGEIQRTAAALSGSGAPERVVVGRVSSGYFDAIGIPVARGRAIEPGDGAAEAPPVMVVTNALAERRFGNANSAVGKALTLDGVTHTIVGVLPPGRGTLGGASADVWPALKLQPPTRRGPFWLGGVGRLKPGVSIQAAERDLASVSDALLPLYTDWHDSAAKLTPIPLSSLIVGTAGRQVGLFAGGVALVLLLAIVNVATLVLVRSSAREPELAVRVMLGARRRRIARLLVTENLLLTLTAGTVGVAMAAVGLDVAITQLPGLPRIQDATLDWRVLSLALGVSVLAGILVSLSPIMGLSGPDALARHAGGRRAGSGLRTGRLRAAFVVTQFALAWPLLVVAGLLSGSFARLQRVDHGFDPDGLAAVAATLPPARYPNAAAVQAFWLVAQQRVAGLPGVTAVGLATQIPPDRSGSTDNFNLVSRPVPRGQSEPQSPWYYVTASYFPALGIDLVEGRTFTAADTSAAFPVVVVSRSWARRYFGRASVAGEQLIQGGCFDCPRTTIIGVVEDIRNLGPALPADAVYGSLTQIAPRSLFVVARQARTTARHAEGMRDALRALDPELPLTVATLSERLDTSLADPRRWAAVLSAFSVVGLGLASIGIFGLMANTVRQRRHEIGVRLALGADPAGVTRLIVTRGLAYAVTGSAVGLAVSLLVASRLRYLLYGVSPTDAATFAGVGLLLLTSALVSTWIPARRAARIRPIEAIASD